MSQIRIECLREFERNKKNDKVDVKKGNELIIEAHQLFMNTEKFFNSIKETVEKYFDSIEKK